MITPDSALLSASVDGARLRAPAISVVIPSHQGAGTIGATLRSLTNQTLAKDRFEIIVIQNGEPDHTLKLIAEICEEHPDLVVRRLEHRASGAGRARNTGLAMARGAYTAFIDDDDVVSPRYLELLLECSAPDTVGVAQVADVQEVDAAPDFGNRLARQLVLSDRTVPAGQAISAMTYTWGKLLPTALARSIGFDPQLRSGEDIVFYLRFFLRYPLKLRFVPLDSHAIYYRSVVPGSLSRQAWSYDFNVTQRLDVLECIEALEPTETWQRSAIKARTAAQTRRMNEFLRVRPAELPGVLRDVCRRGLTTVPLDILLAGVCEAQLSEAEMFDDALASAQLSMVS